MDINELVLKAIDERKGYNIYDYDTRSLTPFVDHMIVASTNNLRQNNAIAQNIKDKLKENGYEGSIRIEGNLNSRWLLIDLDQTVVHLFVNEERQVYQIDRLYSDVPMKVYDI